MLARTRPLGFDPFKGYRRKERNVRDLRVREAIKEIAQMDGAFVVARDGTVEAACRLVDAPVTGLTLPKGLGTRHWAAAAITAVTKALAVVVSQSNGTVRLFQDGEVILRIAPMRHARAMKWQDAETEPAPPAPGPTASATGRRRRIATARRRSRPRRSPPSRRPRPLPGPPEPLESVPMAWFLAILVEPLYRLLYGRPLDDRLPFREARAGGPRRRRASGPCRGLVLVADGVGGLDLCGTALRYVLAAEGLPYAIRVFPWGHGFGRWYSDLTNVTNRDAKAALLADAVSGFTAAQPGDPVFLVAKSGGSGVVVKALERLDEGVGRACHPAGPGALARLRPVGRAACGAAATSSSSGRRWT